MDLSTGGVFRVTLQLLAEGSEKNGDGSGSFEVLEVLQRLPGLLGSLKTLVL